MSHKLERILNNENRSPDEVTFLVDEYKKKNFPFYSDDELSLLFQADEINFKATHNIKLDEPNRSLIIPDSIWGHQNEGHSTFAGADYRKTLDVRQMYDFLGRDFSKEAKMRLNEILDVKEFAKKVIDDGVLGGKILKYEKNDGSLILGSLSLDGLTLKYPREFIFGFVMMSYLDRPEYRAKAEEYFKHKSYNNEDLKIGRGKDLFFDIEKMMKYSIDPMELSENAHSNEYIDWLKEKGIVVEKEKISEDDPLLKPYFVRTVDGLGCSDNAAFITIGAMAGGGEKGRAAVIGAYMNDAIDTYDKILSEHVMDGYDVKIGNEIREYFKKKTGTDIIPDEKWIYYMIYNSAKDNVPEMEFSSSHRRFNEVYEESNGKSELEFLLDYVGNRKIPKTDINFSFSQVPAKSVFKWWEKRVSQLNNIIEKDEYELKNNIDKFATAVQYEQA